jgi:hypothetical protein
MLYTIYSVFAGLLMLVICFITVFIEKSFWKRTMLAVIAFIALPAVTGDYRLLFFFHPSLSLHHRGEKRQAGPCLFDCFLLFPDTKDIFLRAKAADDVFLSSLLFSRPLRQQHQHFHLFEPSGHDFLRVFDRKRWYSIKEKRKGRNIQI